MLISLCYLALELTNDREVTHIYCRKFIFDTQILEGMRVDLSPRLGVHTVANQPPTTVLLSFTFILSPIPPRNGVRSHSRCGTES